MRPSLRRPRRVRRCRAISSRRRFKPATTSTTGAGTPTLRRTAIAWESLYREIVADERIVYTSVLCEDETVATASLTTVEFLPAEQGTRLVLVEAGAYLDGREQPAWREEGTGDWLDALRRHLDGATSSR
jgi:uncharacterized protein YndB with AHSA1/START domain